MDSLGGLHAAPIEVSPSLSRFRQECAEVVTEVDAFDAGRDAKHGSGIAIDAEGDTEWGVLPVILPISRWMGRF